MQTVKLYLALILASSLLLPLAWAEESKQPKRPALIAVPSFQAEMSDGTPVYAIVVIPSENVLNKNEAWLEWERKWPTTYRLNTINED